MRFGWNAQRILTPLLTAIIVLSSPGLRAADADANAKLQAILNEWKTAQSSKQYEQAIKLMEQAKTFIPQNPVPDYNIACGLALLGRKAEAIAALRSAVQKGLADVKQLQSDSDLANIRDEKEFVDLLSQVQKAVEQQKEALAKIPPRKSEVWRPNEVKKGELLPVFVFLHGMWGSPQELEPALKPLADQLHAVVLAPCASVLLGVKANGAPGYTWESNKDQVNIVAAIKQMLKEDGIDPHRVYLCGFSAGGSMCYAVASHNADLFTGVIPMSGGLQPGLVTPEQLKQATAKLPVYIVHGKRDPMMSFQMAQNAYDLLKSAGRSVHLYTFDGQHSFPPDYANVLKEAIAWIDHERAALVK